MAPGLVGEELFELAIVHVFSHSASEFSEPLFTTSSTGNHEVASRRGRLLFDYFLLATQEKVISPGSATRRFNNKKDECSASAEKMPGSGYAFFIHAMQ